MLTVIFKLAGAIELLFLLLGAAVPKLRVVLPLGGSDIAQIGIIFGSVGFIYQMTELIQQIGAR